MPYYEYQCVVHGNFLTQQRDDTMPCTQVTSGVDPLVCGLVSKRRWSLAIQTGMPTHYNQALGKEVSSQRQVKEGLKIASEEATERTGIDHDFQPVDLRDKEGLGVTEEGMEATNRVKRDLGQTEGKFHSSVSDMLPDA